MDYELVLKLKNAGFPFKVGNYCYRHCEGHDEDKETWNDYMGKCSGYGNEGKCSCICHAIPTLSELIEACVKDKTLFTLILSGNQWMCGSGISVTNGKTAVGSTPSEAVANLWLSLHNGLNYKIDTHMHVGGGNGKGWII